MFENVLVGVDGRSGGRDAVALARRLAPTGRLTLLHVHGGRLHPLHAIDPELLRAEEDASRRLLEDERAACEVDAQLQDVVASSPGAGLHGRAEEQGADLIVVGSSSRGLVGRATLGDDTRAALNGAPCAVAIAARGYAERPLPFANIGVAYNTSPESEAALACARELAEATHAHVRALEVVLIPSFSFTGMVPLAFGETVETLIEEARERMAKLDGVEGRAAYGLAGEELAAFGDEVDLLVVGSRGYGPLKRLVVGSTSDYLQRHARCSLLVLPRSSAAGGGETPDAASASAAGGASVTV